MTVRLQDLFLLEQAFDQRNSDMLLAQMQSKNSFAAYAKLVWLVECAEYQQAIDYGKELFANSQNLVEKVFVHHWVIGCMESLYQEQARRQWLENWKQINNWATLPWVKFIKKYQLAIGLYFDSYFREALSMFEQLTEETKIIGYERGMEKCLYHIALIYKCINQHEKSLDMLKQTKIIAYSRGSARMLVRIEEVEKTLNNSVWSSGLDLKTIELLLRENKNRTARKLLLHALRVRRVEKRTWGACSEPMYMALVTLSFGNVRRFEKIYSTHIKDNLIKEKTISLALQLDLHLPQYFIDDLTYLRQICGVSSATAGKTSEFLGINLNKVSDPEAIAVIRNLSSSIEGLSKEELCVKLWNYSYDPSLHDRRIYKLVHRIKVIFKCKDAIIAKGGLYRINPKYLHC